MQAYPPFLDFLDKRLRNIHAHMIEHHGVEGLSASVEFHDGQVVFRFADWQGNLYDLRESSPIVEVALGFVRGAGADIAKVMQLIKLRRAQLFLVQPDDELTLVDMVLPPQKLASPGMLASLFDRFIRLQQIKWTGRLTEEILGDLMMQRSPCILKPTRYQAYEENDRYWPLYGEYKPGTR